MATAKADRRQRLKYHIRKKVKGSSERPRLSVFRSNTSIYAQIIDDINGVTLASASSVDLGGRKENANVDTALQVGKKIAEKAQEAGVQTVVFDRNGYLYHGKVKALAEGAREGGLKF
ncbi:MULTISPECIES: 50S ribosomal protein L18 [Dyadobacter]|jgi:large subunit ribosomal protein L18|uniref:Large ribosomal subunit protein uL18 n=1 Tax=Dyadobacter chenhuakuii TaxID=2909339 RepID=A0A9X1QF59_9BACT|nr:MULTISPECIES: 50S ribosomal protein L18 [Dyadobacter]MCE7069260.1 50S ribosomal protein L18 [Dyadobacter sp. CY327]MCF2495210.1 50S ribosomal protein L18 [Dyadobacter chenhuakuii]MCF2500251.1 50S ribosomal protein L18 [Dyadobacter chenhuakuii]MCF2516207.1 50S ribosomal protein L18 [Dyadobacter sp. CY351]USJ29252.1 50S ribosomal protein L18 [Dyadobacter chenhuakuii]